MRIDLKDGSTVSVTFHYDLPQGAIGTRETNCTIRFVKPNQKTEDGQLVGQSKIVRHVNDPDNKFTARKVALSKALKNAKMSKSHRTDIWKGYLAKVRMPAN